MRSDATSALFAKGTATRQRILDAAVARFASQGFRDTTVAAIARDAGVTAPAVHAYYGSKLELFRAAFEYDVAPVLAAFHGGGGPGRQLALDGTAAQDGLVPRVAAEFAEHPLATRIMRGNEPDHTAGLMALPAVVQAHDQLTRRVAEDQRAGLLRDDLPAGALADALETLVFALLLGPAPVSGEGSGEGNGEMSGEHAGPGRRQAIAAVISRGIRPGQPR